ncbi:MAG: TolC family protein [Lentisphaerae bacterium]|nr:TolC family protein [Lentisphaerota bacterium]
MRLSPFCSALLLVCVATVCRGESRSFSLVDCVTYGLEHSLALRNAAIDEAISRARMERVEGAYDPRVSGELSYTDSELRDATSFFLVDHRLTAGGVSLGKAFDSGTRVALRADHSHIEAGGDVGALLTTPYSSALTLSLSQSLLRNAFGRSDQARRAGAHAMSRAARLAYGRECELTAGRIAEAYWVLYSARKNCETGQESLARAEELLATQRDRVEDGLLERTDLLASEALIATRQVEVLSLSNRVENAEELLKNSMQLPHAEWADVSIVAADDAALAERLVAPIEESEATYRAALAARKDLAAMAELMVQAESDLEWQKSEYRHDLELFGQLGRGSSDQDVEGSLAFDDSAWMVGLRVDIGWGRTAERSLLREARLMHRKAVNNRDSMQAAIGLECARAVRNEDNGWERVAATRHAADLQSRKLTLEQEKYEQGRSAIHWIVQFEDDYALAQANYNLALAAYHVAVVQYRLARGDAPVPGVEGEW